MFLRYFGINYSIKADACFFLHTPRKLTLSVETQVTSFSQLLKCIFFMGNTWFAGDTLRDKRLFTKRNNEHIERLLVYYCLPTTIVTMQIAGYQKSVIIGEFSSISGIYFFIKQLRLVISKKAVWSSLETGDRKVALCESRWAYIFVAPVEEGDNQFQWKNTPEKRRNMGIT